MLKGASISSIADALAAHKRRCVWPADTLRVRIDAVRHSLGWSWQRLAGEIGLPRSTLQNYYLGVRAPTARNRARLKKAFGLADSDIPHETHAPTHRKRRLIRLSSRATASHNHPGHEQRMLAHTARVAHGMKEQIA